MVDGGGVKNEIGVPLNVDYSHPTHSSPRLDKSTWMCVCNYLTLKSLGSLD